MSGTADPLSFSDSAGELRTLQLVQADIDWLRSCKVEWDGGEAGAPFIEPVSQYLFSAEAEKRLATLLPLFFLHARFEKGVYDIGAQQPFTVLPDHLKLLHIANWQGAAIDCKRPYGDFTNFTIDMASALDLSITAGPDRIARISAEDEKRMNALHLQMQNVVVAYLRHATLKPGTYITPSGGFEPEGAARPRLAPPTGDDFQNFLKEISVARKSSESWRPFSAIAGLYSPT